MAKFLTCQLLPDIRGLLYHFLNILLIVHNMYSSIINLCIFCIRVSTVSLDNDIQTTSSSTLVAGGKIIVPTYVHALYYNCILLQKEYDLICRL